MRIKVGVSIARITLALIIVALVLVALSYAANAYVVLNDIEKGQFGDFRHSLSVGEEANIPTWFSSTMLALAGLLFLLITVHKQQTGGTYARSWLMLGVIFFALSLDEAAELHERTIHPLRDFLNTGGLLFFAWIIPGLIFVAIFDVVYFPFLRHLPPSIQKLFVIAAIFYLGGAVVMEAIGGEFYQSRGFVGEDIVGSHQDVMTFVTIGHLEEALEMLGVVILIHALLTYLKLTEHPLFDFAAE